mgnify:CR=1 FL=1
MNNYAKADWKDIIIWILIAIAFLLVFYSILTGN